jgi:predicted phage baseplate assembly protein
MPLPAPNLDDRTFQDLVDETKRLIPRYCPEWTDHNVSDPGVTLIELFAYMVDLLLYRINRVPERNYIKWLDLLGIRLEPPRPARVDLTFYLTAPQPQPVTIPAGTEVATIRTDSQAAILFSTEQDLTLAVPTLIACLVNRSEQDFHDYGIALRNPILNIGIFQDPPQPNDAIYFGYGEDLANHLLHLHLTTTVEGVGIDPQDPPRAWEYWSTAGAWKDLEVAQDSTGGFNRTGDVYLHVPHDATRRVLGGREGFWIRARATSPRSDQPAYAGSPRIIAITTTVVGGTIVASQWTRVANEVLGRSDGQAGQEWALQNPPILPRQPGETLEVEQPDGSFEHWVEVPDFGGSDPDDPHFTLDSVTGVVRFGPTLRDAQGRARHLGRTPAANRLLRFTGYRTGGGQAGNVGHDTITVLKSSIPYVGRVTNRGGAVGGEDAESVELAKLRAPHRVHSWTRAVTAEDFEHLTREATPEIARVRCLPPPAAGPGIVGPPVVRILVVPRVAQTESQVPRADLLRLSERVRGEIMAYLNARRLLTTIIELSAFEYTWVRVELHVRARRRTDPQAICAAIERRLYHYIHPVLGGPAGDGRALDEPLYLSEVYALVQGMEGVEYVESVQLFTVDPATGARIPAGTSVTPPPGGLLASDEHQVSVQ